MNVQNHPLINVVELTPALARKISESAPAGFGSFEAQEAPTLTIGAGDQVEISIWEAAPALLFGGAPVQEEAGIAPHRMALPAQMVEADGAITVPFAGRIRAAGRTPSELESEIRKALGAQANRPQVLVRIARPASQDVSVVGEVASSVRMPLTARGERVLDAIAAAGGVKMPVEKATLQLARGGEVRRVGLETVIREPRQNVVLMPGDVVTAYYQPSAFTALGAVSKVGEVPFEATGLSLAQALARVGGLADNRANRTGVFLFRSESGAPVIYRLDLSQPESFLAMRELQMHDKDVLYVANAPLAEIRKFMEIVGTMVYPATQILY
jgi:polysaccharide export outer membrane protein